MEELFTVKEVCDKLKCSRSFVWKLMEQGLLKHNAIGTLRRIPASSLSDLIRRTKTESQDVGRQNQGKVRATKLRG